MSTKLSSDTHAGTNAADEPRAARDSASADQLIDRRPDFADHQPGHAVGSSDRSDSAAANRWLWRGLVTLGTLTVIALIIAWISWGTLAKATYSGLTHTISRGDLIVTVVEQGTLESANNAEIKCKIRGYSTVTWVVEGGTVVEPGDELIRLDTKRIEEEISKHSTDAFEAKATYERTKADVARAEIAINAYLQGSYLTELKSLEKQLALAKSNYESAQKILGHSENMFRRGYVSNYEVQSNRFRVRQTELELKVRQTAIDVLNNYTKQMELETLRGELRSLQFKLEADKAGLAMDEGRRDRAIQELEYCVVKAERRGLVIYPSAAEWKETPEITEGANVRHDQVLLLMPDLSEMQIKVGIHEALVDRLQQGQNAKSLCQAFPLKGRSKRLPRLPGQPAGGRATS
jgi:HlyD family secretion protein